ncbi:hypothetical protein AAC387_Pa02g3404 [Persea americana]
MEESVKRRERLEAMRMEAAEVEASNSQVTTTGLGNLSNPLLDWVPTPYVPEDRHALSSPMTASSSSKKRNHNGCLNHQGHFSPPFNNNSLMGQMSSTCSASNSNQRPAQSHINYSSSLHCYGRGLVPDYGRGSSRPKTINPRRGNYHRRFNNVPDPGLGWTNWRGGGCHAFVSAQVQPQRFYRKSMVEDPWRFLKPVISASTAMLKGDLKTHDFLKSSLTRSLSLKKVKTC